MLDALLNILNGFTDIPFVELAWSHSPDDKYGVITLDTQLALDADADPVSEKMLTGFVDVFVRKPKDLSTVSDVESAMKRLGIWFAMNSVQFEDDTGYVHYEWIWRDTNNILFITFRILFEWESGNELKMAHYYETPKAPHVDGYKDYDYLHDFDSWDKPIEPATQNIIYNAVYRVDIFCNDHEFIVNDVDMPFTAEQISHFVDDFPYLRVLVHTDDGLYYATDVDEQYVYWGDGKDAQWA